MNSAPASHQNTTWLTAAWITATLHTLTTILTTTLKPSTSTSTHRTGNTTGEVVTTDNATRASVAPQGARKETALHPSIARPATPSDDTLRNPSHQVIDRTPDHHQ